MTVESISVVEPAELAPLSADERNDLARLEGDIQTGVEQFIRVGEALAEIRDRRLYRESHGAFPEYLAARWPQFNGRRQADRLIAAAEVERDLRPIGLTVTNESQARPLAALTSDERRQAMQAATEAAGGTQPTAAQVQAAAQQVRPPAPRPSKPAPPAPAAPPKPVELIPLTPSAPTGAPTVLATAPATAPGELPPLLFSTPPPPAPLPPPLFGPSQPPPAPAPIFGEPAACGAAPADLLRLAESLVALLEQALTLAEVRRDQVRHEHGADEPPRLDDDAVEQGARELLASATIQAAAAKLAAVQAVLP